MASSNVPSPAPLLQRTAVAIVDKPVSVILALLPQTVTFGPAGPNVTVCGNNANITLTGLSTIATAVLWSNGAGDGTFDDATAANAVYTPGSSDISLGTVILTLNTTAQGKCTAVSDFLTLTISPSPTVDAGLGQTVCGNNGDVSLTGISNTVATAWLWTSSSGNGTFYFIELNTMIIFGKTYYY